MFNLTELPEFKTPMAECFNQWENVLIETVFTTLYYLMLVRGQVERSHFNTIEWLCTLIPVISEDNLVLTQNVNKHISRKKFLQINGNGFKNTKRYRDRSVS